MSKGYANFVSYTLLIVKSTYILLFRLQQWLLSLTVELLLVQIHEQPGGINRITLLNLKKEDNTFFLENYLQLKNYNPFF